MKRLALAATAALLFTLGACGDDETTINIGADCTSDDECSGGGVCRDGSCADPGGGGGTDTGLDSSNPTLDAGTTDTPGGDTVDDDGGGVCENICVRNSDCSETGLDNPRCVDGCCVESEEPTGDDCTSHLQACSSADSTTDNFFCDVERGECLQRCDLDSASDTESGDCPLRSYCFIELTTTEPDELNGACLPGDCDTNIFDDTACDGEGTCVAVGNEASYCFPAGTADVGDDCNLEIDEDDGSQPPSDSCMQGLRCFRNTCVEVCDLQGDAGADCGDEECVEVFDTTSRNRYGLCGTECDAFSDTCDDGSYCSITFGRFGLNDWLCVEETGEEQGEGESCTDGEPCEEGLLCLGVSDTRAECTRICEPLSGEEAYSDCGEESDGSGEGSGEGDIVEVCRPISIEGLGICNESCSPYPRRELADYGCSNEDDGCIPFVATDEEIVDVQGTCSEDTGTIEPYEVCEDAGVFGGGCEDLAVCLTLETGEDPRCLPVCEPLGDQGCPDDGTCSGVQSLLGGVSLSFCLPEDFTQDGEVGDSCETFGADCSGDHSVCWEVAPETNECVQVCRVGFEDCPSGTDCTTDGLNPEVVPEYMGVCL